MRGCGQVRRATSATIHAGLPMTDLGEQVGDRYSARQRPAVSPVGGEDLVVLTEGRGRAHRHRLLTDAEVDGSGDLALPAELQAALLETTDQQHLAVGLGQGYGRGSGSAWFS